jgi:acyl-CoA synthetase (AMP-forming)/AMP-acid ligase II
MSGRARLHGTTGLRETPFLLYHATRPGPFVFVDEAGRPSSWDPEAERGHIHAVARYLAAELPAGAAIGLLFRSGPELVATWFACVNAGLKPLIVQYPTRKQSRAYWYDSVTNSMMTAGLAAIIADAYCAGLGLPDSVRIIEAASLPSEAVSDAGPLLPEQFAILQLSSGTTGYRKAMEFGGDALRRHAADFNQVLGLEAGRDRIISWLPLYHDMGYVACFVMPILLGIDVVMMDPVTWVQSPELLFDAIEQHEGTICYMPNFGFEVMTRAPGRTLPSMRHWISCSEPVSAVTAQKFCSHIGADPARVIDGADVVSCGKPIPGVALKTVEGEIWARSPTSLSHYLGGEDLRDADGYYPTGDLGQILDGVLYVAGRKQDVLIQAGRKFMLSDVDLKLNEAFPEVRGRAATLAVHDARLGTETPLILIEALDFFERRDMAEMAARMVDLTGMDQVEVAYVPPRFLTKTSSGKINRRKTREDWLAVLAARHRSGGSRDAVQELLAAFGHVAWDRPMKEVLDSLSMAIIAITLELTAVAFDPAKSLNEMAEEWRLASSADTPDGLEVQQSIRIVSLADRRVLTALTEADLEAMSAALGCTVTLEHICLPPTPVVMSDLVFHEWFQPRLDQEPFSNVDGALDRLREASLILVDSFSEFFFLYESVYPVLSHNLERNPAADLLCFRWQNYTKQHEKLPLSFVSGRDITLDSINQSLVQLGRYLNKPIFRIASIPGFHKYTADWECHIPVKGAEDRSAGGGFVAELTRWIAARPEIERVKPRGGAKLMMSDLAHFCGVMARKGAVDGTAESYNSFYIGAQSASLPYLRQRLDEMGKPYALTASIAKETLASLPGPYECLVACGSWGAAPYNMPLVSFQHVGDQGTRTRHLDMSKPGLRAVMPLNDTPPSPGDWYHAFALNRDEHARDEWRKARQTFAGQWKVLRAYVGGANGAAMNAEADLVDAGDPY